MNRTSQSIECFLCPQIVKSKDDYKTHLEEGHNMSSAEDVFKLFNKDKNRTKTSKAKSKRKIKEHFNTKLKKLFNQGGKKVKETLSSKCKLKSVRVNLKNIHMPKDDVFYEDLGGIPWYDRVKYQCLPCGKYFWGKRTINKHVQKFHEIIEFTLNCYRLVSEDDKYMCKICNSVIKMAYDNIRQHLIFVHKTNISKYSSVYEHDKIFNANSQDLRSFKKSEFYGIKWYNRVRYQCNFCKQQIIGHRCIKSHIKRCHGKKSFNNYTTLSRNAYFCKICKKQMILDYITIWKHVDKVHGMSFKEYEEKYESIKSEYATVTNIGQYHCKICDNNTLYKVSDLSKHLETKHSTTKTSYQEIFGELIIGNRGLKIITAAKKDNTIEKDEVQTPFQLPPTSTPPSSYLCPLPSCSFSLPKPEMKAGGGAKHMVVDHCFTAKDVGAAKWKWEKKFNVGSKI